MATRSALVGRSAERERLREAFDRARLGDGSLVLVAGEAGVGKTRLLEDLAGEAADGRPAGRALWGRASHDAATPYGPIVAALRSYLRSQPDALDDLGAFKPHLALILPELGRPAKSGDRPALFEAVRCAFAKAATEEPLLVVLDDLHWSDDATLELLPALAEPLTELPVLVVAAYRSDGLPRDHMLRRLRHQLRRGGRLDELTLAPLGEAETAELAERTLGTAPAPSLVRVIHDRTQGVPFFVEELARALAMTSALTEGRRGLELAKGGEVPLPDTVRDAVMISTSELSPEARDAASAAAVAGEEFDLELVAGVANERGLAEVVERGLVVETGGGRAIFRHALTREALYADVARAALAPPPAGRGARGRRGKRRRAGHSLARRTRGLPRARGSVARGRGIARRARLPRRRPRRP
jgi:predicted ATPase